MWRLSTLGGAVSAMGFFSEKFVKAALRVSLRQLKIAQILGDPISIARCYLYISLGLAQDGHFKKAITTVREKQIIKIWIFSILNNIYLIFIFLAVFKNF
uniref:Uncharacterized protein n=1 Tax=Meloidogyne incognita TaxID=6306 RepID=A0A914KUM7_MELIC